MCIRDRFVEELGEYDHDRVKFLTCQEVDDEFTAARDILKELACLLYTPVVAAVPQERGRVPQQLEPARPADRFKTGTDGAFRNVPAMGAHHPQSRDCLLYTSRCV